MKKYEYRNRRYFAGALISILCSNLFAVSLQFFKGDVLDYAVAGDVNSTVLYGALLIAFILCEVFLYFVHKRLSAKFVVGCTRNLKQDIFASIFSRSYVSFKEHPQGEYLSKYSNEADTIKNRRFSMLPMFWDILSKIVFVSIALFLLDWRIAIITIALLTTPLYIPKLIEKPLQNAQAESINAVEHALSRATDLLSGFEVIKNFSAEHAIISRFHSVNDHASDKCLQEEQLSAVAQLITTLISYLSYFIVLACSAWLVWSGDFSAGDFFVAIGMIDQLSYPLISLAGITRQLIAIRPTCQMMETFLEDTNPLQEVNRTDTFNQCIQFRGVDFAYDASTPILSDFNLTIEKGKRYLLQGPSGCGKTTAVNLLLRYYDATNGSIFIDGQNINAFDSTYGFMTVVRQEATLFNDTLRNNLTMYQSMPDTELLSVVNSVGLEKYASVEMLDSMVSEDGSNFSGGEKKRICLARALLRHTDVLILDEPLANLDAATAEKIEDLLLSIKNKTLLVVSHQFTAEKLSAFDSVINFNMSNSYREVQVITAAYIVQCKKKARCVSTGL